MLLILVDAHSKWIEVFPTNHSTSAVVIENLRRVFAQFGLPEVLVSDNGSCLVSKEFNTFLLANGVKQITSAPYNPATNGLAERAVQTVKRGLKKDRDGSLEARLARILMIYRLTPHSTTGVSPAELLLGRQPRSRLDLLKPNTANRVEASQSRQKKSHDATARMRTLKVGDKVYSKNFGQGQKWTPGVIAEVTGPVSFLVKLAAGQLVRRHQDHLRIRYNLEIEEPPDKEEGGEIATQEEEPTVEKTPASIDVPEVVLAPMEEPRGVETPPAVSPRVSEDTRPLEEVDTPGGATSARQPPTQRQTPLKVYPKRNRAQPKWFEGPCQSSAGVAGFRDN